ncbi:MAG: AI-2E family transporter [Campylobacteraceae bacterium]
MNINRIFLIGIFLVALYWVLNLYSPYIMDITIASLLALAMYNIHIFFLKYARYPMAAALLTTLVLCVMFVAPIAYTIVSLAQIPTNFDSNVLAKALDFIKDLQNKIPESLQFIKPYVVDFAKDINLANATNKIVTYATVIGKLGIGFFMHAALIIIFFFFALLYGKQIAEYVKSVLPMGNNEIEALFSEVANVMGVVFYSLILNAILQGVLFGVMITFFGYNGLLLGILFGIASLVPVFGGTLVWIPIAIIEISHGSTGSAIFIGLYSIIVISLTADTLIKPSMIKWISEKLVRTPTKINEMLIFFAIIAGLTTFGFWGMILGPAITTFFISLLKLYKMIKDGEFKSIDIQVPDKAKDE